VGGRRLVLVNGDRGAGAGGGPHPRTAPGLTLWWQGGRRRGGSSSAGDEVEGVAPDPPAAPAAMPGCWLRVESRRRPPSSICAGHRLPVVDRQGVGRIYSMEGVWWLQTARRRWDPAAEDRRRRRPCRDCCGWELRLGLEKP
jgi:hypothetical protein